MGSQDRYRDTPPPFVHPSISLNRTRVNSKSSKFSHSSSLKFSGLQGRGFRAVGECTGKERGKKKNSLENANRLRERRNGKISV